MPISSDVRAHAPELVELRRTIHRHPEPGFQEKKTAELIRSRLKSWGVSHKRVCDTGVVALVRGARPGPTILLRADMDALPLTEENDVPYASTVPGFMHACGHDGHVAMALVATALLEKRKADLAGTVKVMFQPAEEGPDGGAEPMIEAGLLERPKVDAAFALHLWNDLPVGKLGVREGPVFASTDEFTLKVVGKGGHGAAPHQTVDPVVVAAAIVTTSQSIVARRVDPTRTAVVTFGQVHGGTRHNIIPDFVTLNGTVRALEASVRALLRRELTRMMRDVASAHGATIELDFKVGYPPTRNDAGMTTVARAAAEAAVGRAHVVEQDVSMGAEDMSYVLEKVPGCYVVVGSANRKRGLDAPHHSSRFDFDEKALENGVEFWLRLAARGLT